MSVSTTFPDYPSMTCPKCGDQQTDFDGFGFMACTACGYCTHPAWNGGICGICGDIGDADNETDSREGT